jgi:hypothetical protein
MMKIAAFSTKPYDREFLASANDSVHELRFFEPRLTMCDLKVEKLFAIRALLSIVQ